MKLLNFLLFFLYAIMIIASDSEKEKKSFLDQREKDEKGEHYNARMVIICSRLEKTLNEKQVENFKTKTKKERKLFLVHARLAEALAYQDFMMNQKIEDRKATISPLAEYASNTDSSIIINEPGFVSIQRPANVPNLNFGKSKLPDILLEDKERCEINYQEEAKKIVQQIQVDAKEQEQNSLELNDFIISDFDMCDQEDN